MFRDQKGKGVRRLLATLMLTLSVSVCGTAALLAQEGAGETKGAASKVAASTGRSMVVGLGLGAVSIPEDEDAEKKGLPVEAFFDWDIDRKWLKFRFGYNMYKATVDFDAWNKSWENELKSSALYAAYRYSMEPVANLDAFAAVGLAYVSSSLAIDNGGDTEKDAGLGYMFGVGSMYYFGNFGVGGQFEYFSYEASFDGAKVATGSNQLQLIAAYAF